ncbi:MAG: diacylglycerol/lipid kinase family protein [Motilibacteraceae bacterium]
MTVPAAPTTEHPAEDQRGRRWAAEAALALPVCVILVVLAVAGLRSLTVLLLTALTLALELAALFWVLAARGVLRWAAAALAVVAPALLVVILVGNRLLWLVLVAVGLLAVAMLSARFALRPAADEWHMPEHPAPPPRHPFVLMNPRSGGGKVARFGLVEKAETLGAEVALLEPGDDVVALVRDAVARGADALGVAGGDGTQALVAAVAAECDVPLVVVSAGTRNHFALDLGLDREDPSRCLDAMGEDGVELRVDLGMVAGRPFVNNASFGAYAQIVQSPAYRDDKRGTTLEQLPDLIAGHRGARLRAVADGTVVQEPQALLVSNNPYEASDIAGMGRRARLDRGRLGIVAVKVTSAWQAAELLRRRRGSGLQRSESTEVVVEADQPHIPVGIDGEAVLLPTPVRCTVLPQALRVRVPSHRPGIRAPRGQVDLPALWQLALGRGL